jgi:hypothetical protein
LYEKKRRLRRNVLAGKISPAQMKEALNQYAITLGVRALIDAITTDSGIPAGGSMSRANIISMGWSGRFFQVTFAARDGDRTYEYDPVSGAAIAAGADPHNYSGVEVGALDRAEGLAEDVEELAEAAELLAL